MSKITYSPKSHFFVDHTHLVAPVAANIETDAFGPVGSDKPNKFRTTSFVRASATSAVYAICDGQLLIEQQAGSTTKVNLVLKPSALFAPLKIKYFIYRGVEKQKLITVLEQMKPIDGADPAEFSFLRKIWTNSLNLNHAGYLAGGGAIENPPEPIPAILLGYDPNAPDSKLLDEMFFTNPALNPDFQLPNCKKGDYIANFTGAIGLDIILDDGDYSLDYEEQLFKLDLGFARKPDNVIDLTTIADADKHKKYKEHIHRFIDAAAFWGSHIDCGEIKVKGATTPKKLVADIYPLLVNKYQTANNIYLFIRSERERSYNFYGTYPIDNLGFALNGPVPPLSPYATDTWPIVIKSFPQPTATPVNKLQLSLNFNIDADISSQLVTDVIPNYTIVVDQNISLYGIIPNRKGDTFTIDKQLRNPEVINGQTKAIKDIPLKNYVSGASSKSVASFLMFSFAGNQELTFKNYFNDLWRADLKPNFKPPVTAEMGLWAVHTQTKLTNFKPVTGFNNTCTQQKVLLDNGINGANRKKRNLFIASISDTYTDPKDNHSNVVVKGFKSGFQDALTKDVPVQSGYETYIKSLYEKPNLDIYKGSILDGGATIQTLSLVSNTDYETVWGYFQLGITEEEYNKLLYNDLDVPSPLPAMPHVLTDASNITFHLEEDTTIPLTKDYRKFKLGLLFENKKGELQPVLYPATAANEVYVYTVDNQFFFSKEFSDYQPFYKEFAKAKVEFRTKIAYNGEFGFDWLRIGDNADASYLTDVLSGYESHSPGDIIKTEYESVPEAARAWKREYMRIPTYKRDDFYYTPYMNIFPSTWIKAPMPPSEVELRVLVEIDVNHDKLEFDYDLTYFDIDKPALSDKVAIAKGESLDHTIKITCIKDFAEHKKIRVLAYEVGKPKKEDAKLAGEIIVLKNSLAFRKQQKFVLVKVSTNISGGAVKTGSFIPAEVEGLRGALYQALAYGILSYGPDLDLTAVDDYRIKDPLGASIYGKFIYKAGYIGDPDLAGGLFHKYMYPKRPMFIDLRNRYILKYPRYAKHFTVFCFDEPTSTRSTLGSVEKIGIHNLCLFAPIPPPIPPPRDNTTLNHEAFHGNGLYHTHSDGDIEDPRAKYIFIEGNSLNNPNATDNIMSYQSLAISSWKWQWKIVQLHIK